MKLDVRDNLERHRFETDVDGMLAIAEYERNGGTIIFTHTMVPPHHQGEGIGEALAHAALESAKSRNLKVVPQCPFIAAYIDKHPEYQELLASS